MYFKNEKCFLLISLVKLQIWVAKNADSIENFYFLYLQLLHIQKVWGIKSVLDSIKVLLLQPIVFRNLNLKQQNQFRCI